MEKNVKKKKGFINRDVGVFLFFLIFSFFLWYLNSLEKEAEADIRRAVKYINVPKGRLLSDDSPARVNISLKGPGYSILKLKYPGKKLPLTIDLAKITYKKLPESKASDYYILTSGLIKTFTVQLRVGCDVTSVKPDTLFISFEKGNPK